MKSAVSTVPALAFSRGAFTVTLGGKSARVALVEEPPEVRDAVAFRRNDRYVVWDERGLTIRGERGAVTTRLGDLTVSPKLFSKEEIRRNLALFKTGARTKGADALSGAVRIGTGVYLLPRWTDAKGKTWLEPLIRVDLDEENPKPKLVGRFAGTTLAYLPIDDELTVTDSRPVAIVRSEASWGVAAALPVAQEFGYIPLGTDLRWLVGTGYAERTAYGTTIVGTVDRRTMVRTMRLETRGDPVTPVGPEARIVTFEMEGSTVVADTRTGAQLELPGSLSARAVTLPGRPPTVVLFDDVLSPSRAWVVESGSGLAIVGRWVAK